MLTLKKTVCALIAVILIAAAFAGCGYNPETVMTINGYEIPAGIFLYYQMSAAAMAEQKYAAALDADSADAANYLDGEIEGVPTREWINTQTDTLLKQYVYVEQEYDRLGLVMSDYDYYYAENYLGNYWQYFGDNYMKNGINNQTYLKSLHNTYKSGLLLEKLYGEGGEHEIPMADLEQAFLENYVNTDYIKFPTKDSAGTALDYAALDVMKAVAAAIQAEAESTGNLKAAFMNNYRPALETVGSIAPDADEDTVTTALEAAYTEIAKENALLRQGDGTLSTDEMTLALGASEGEIAVHSTDTSITLIRKNWFTEEQTAESQKGTLVALVAEQPYIDLRDQTIAGYEIQTDQKARAYYSIDKITLY